MNIDNMKDIKLMRKICEDLAVVKLMSEGYSIIERNATSKVGEISIVCKKGNTICFVETETITHNDSKEIVKQNFKEVSEYYIMTHYANSDVSYKLKRIEVTINEIDIYEA